MTKQKSVVWAGNVAHMETVRNAHTILVKN